MSITFVAGWPTTFSSKIEQASKCSNSRAKWRCVADSGSTQTPLSGSIYSGRARRALRGQFFEGWYFRVTLAETAFAFMYSIEEDPFGDVKGVVQILGPDGECVRKELQDDGKGFWGQERFLSVGHWKGGRWEKEKARRIGKRIFEEGRNEGFEGFQLTGNDSLGRVLDSDRLFEWSVDFKALDGWGSRGDKQRPTASWIGYLPIFEPGWQVLMGHGTSQGTIVWKDKRWDFDDGVVYAEKNWGTGFPEKWWWLQCNRWVGENDLALTAAGGLRGVWPSGLESVGLLAIHYHGEFFEFGSYSCDDLNWNVRPWGRWEMFGTSDSGHKARIIATTDDPGISIEGPGPSFVRDAPYGHINVWLYDPSGKALLDGVSSKLAQVEIGGGPWDEEWNVKCKPLPAPLRSFIDAFNGPKIATST